MSIVDELDQNHILALELLKRVEAEDKAVSKITLLELASVYSRAGLENPLALAHYSIKKVGGKILDTDLNKMSDEAFRLAPTIKLKTLDLLHIAACKTLKIKKIVTFDEDMISKKNAIEEIGIEVVHSLKVTS